jgi:uncharacterized OsmC-like protein
MTPSAVRQYSVQARSTGTHGRVVCTARNHHFVVDGPVENGCPGEAITPGEIFLSAVAACGVELVEVIARDQSVPLKEVRVEISGMMDRSRPVRPDLSVFNSVRLRFQLTGVGPEQGRELVERFKGR